MRGDESSRYPPTPPSPACIRRRRGGRGHDWSRPRDGPDDPATGFEYPARENRPGRARRVSTPARNRNSPSLDPISTPCSPSSYSARMLAAAQPLERRIGRERAVRRCGRRGRRRRGRRRNGQTDPAAAPAPRPCARPDAGRTSWRNRRGTGSRRFVTVPTQRPPSRSSYIDRTRSSGRPFAVVRVSTRSPTSRPMPPPLVANQMLPVPVLQDDADVGLRYPVRRVEAPERRRAIAAAGHRCRRSTRSRRDPCAARSRASRTAPDRTRRSSCRRETASGPGSSR